jgi:hypothetical protein
LTADISLDRPNNATTPPLPYSQAAGRSPHLASIAKLSINHLKKPEHNTGITPHKLIETAIKLNVRCLLWHAPCDALNRMAIIRTICPISTRLAFRAKRRIAPVAPTSCVAGRGARSSSRAEQPAQRNAQTEPAQDTDDHVPYKATFVCQVLGQRAAQRAPCPTVVAERYEVAERIDALKWQWLSARL